MTQAATPLELNVRLFAGAAAIAGDRQLSVTVPSGARLSEVIERILALRPELAALSSISRWAVGNDFVSDDFTFTEATTSLAMIPPVSGG